MKKSQPFFLYLIPVLVLITVFGLFLPCYLIPMEDASLDLSMLSADPFLAAPAEDKGWSVFVFDDGEARALEATGSGAYKGLALGQTFYYARVMSEALDAPTLQIGTANRNFSVWLDETLLYTDCPELDNRIGHVNLPMRDYDRAEPVTVTLPPDYQGKTLTVAQSFPTYTEGGSPVAVAASVRLYCGYSYESGLISESFAAAFGALLCFAIGVVLAVEFLVSKKPASLLTAVTAFALMSWILANTSFAYRYFGQELSAYTNLILPFAAWALVAYLWERSPLARKYSRWPALIHGIGFLAAVVLTVAVPDSPSPTVGFFLEALPEWLATAGMLTALVWGLLRWWKDSRFYRMFVPLSLAGIAAMWAKAILGGEDILLQLWVNLSSGILTYFYMKLLPPLLSAALLSALFDAGKSLLSRHAEQLLERQRTELTAQSNEHFRRQHEEIMMLRHDMLKHLNTLRGMELSPAAEAYLEQLLGQNQRIRAVVSSGNDMVNLLLNTKLSDAADRGIRVEILRAEVPEALPVSDTDLCSLLVNVLDNAITAAEPAKEPYLRIDCHVKGGFFAFRCENSTIAGAVPREPEGHRGFGLRIIQNLAEQYGGMVDTEQKESSFVTRIILPMHQE